MKQGAAMGEASPVATKGRVMVTATPSRVEHLVG